MTPCDPYRNRLLALPDGAEAPPELLAHLGGCEGCRRFRERADRLTADLRALPVPSGEAAKLAFLDSLTAAGPVIKTVPTLPAGRTIPWKKLARPLAGLAAAVAVGFGLWSVRPVKGPERDAAEGPRHELLAKVVELDTKLAKTTGAEERIPLLSEMAAALSAETRGVYQAASAEDVRALASMFDKVVDEGIVAQAGRFDRFAPVDRKHKVLDAAADNLETVRAGAVAMIPSAREQVKGSLERMAKTAQTGREKLLLARKGA